ncbi:MAG: amidohydrolase family protein [Planctomycetota bacterium]
MRDARSARCALDGPFPPSRTLSLLRSALTTLLVGLWLSITANAQESQQPKAPIRALVGARIEPVVGDPIQNGVVLVENGLILAVGDASNTAIPEGAVVVDLSGKVLMPGLVCTHSHVGGPQGADSSHPIQPECRVLDSIDVRDAGIAKARAGGLTTVNVMSGSGHLLSGQTLYVKLRKGDTVDDLALRLPDGSYAGGIKMANGTNPQRNPPFPGTRAKSAALIRALFLKAKRYYDRKLAAENDESIEAPEIDLALEPLCDVLSGKRPVHHHTHRHDDILTVLRIADEFGYRVVLHHVSEAWKVADEIADADVACSVILLDSPGGKIEAKDLRMENATLLAERGVLTAFHTDDGITDSRYFLRMAAFGIRAGLSRQQALESLTIAGAEILELEDRIGSIEVGKDADFCVLSGDPFSIYTKVEQTWIDGTVVFDRSLPEDRLAAEGGLGASDGQAWYLCCAQKQEGGN